MWSDFENLRSRRLYSCLKGSCFSRATIIFIKIAIVLSGSPPQGPMLDIFTSIETFIGTLCNVQNNVLFALFITEVFSKQLINKYLNRDWKRNWNDIEFKFNQFSRRKRRHTQTLNIINLKGTFAILYYFCVMCTLIWFVSLDHS